MKMTILKRHLMFLEDSLQLLVLRRLDVSWLCSGPLLCL